MPVVVIGNITVGGSGKTPLVIWAAHHLAAAGWHPGIVSRGYGGSLSASGGSPVEVTRHSNPAHVGDEPVLLARDCECPVWISADRVAACRALRSHHPECDVLLLDDGLQHYRLSRDVEIAVLDGRGIGNGHLFPAGPLREPPARLDEVDAVVWNGAAHGAGYKMRLEGRALVSLSGDYVIDIAALGAPRVHAVAGIGEPARFFRHLEALGLEVIPHPFPDHHPYTASDFAFDDALPIVMTEKDAVKCHLIVAAEPRFWTLPVRAELDPAFGELLNARLRGRARGSEAA